MLILGGVSLSHTSLRSQIRQSLRNLLKLNEKRFDYKKSGQAQYWIFYYQTFEKYSRDCWSVIRQIRDRHGINMLIKIKPHMVRKEFERRIAAGQSAWTLKAYRAALIKLQYGINHRYGYNVKLVPKDMMLPARRVKLRHDRFAYTPEQTQTIIANSYTLKLPAAAVLDLIACTGLRLHEALKLRALDIQSDILVVHKGKGGKRREIAMTNEAKSLADKLLTSKADMDLIFPGLSESQVRQCLQRACRQAGISVHKVHNLRHQYAVRQYGLKRDAGVCDVTARFEVSQDLGHNRRSVTYAYIPPRIRPGWRD